MANREETTAGRWASPDLVRAAIAGEDAAADRLITQIWPACFRLAASVIGDWNLAKDAAQEACIIIHHKVATLREADAFDAWVFRIVVRESGRVRRRHERPESPLYANGFSTDQAITIDVWRALAGLPPVLRDVTVLFYFDDLKSEEIARILGVPHATVRTRLARARERLRASLDDYADQPHWDNREVTNHAI